MKKLILSLFVMGALSFATPSSYALSQDQDDVVTNLDEKVDKTEIQMTEVPQEVKEAWAKNAYSKEKVERIFKVTDSENGDYIEFLVKSSNGKIAVHFSLEGKLLSEKAVS